MVLWLCMCVYKTNYYSWYGMIVCACVRVCACEYMCMLTNHCTYPMQLLKSYPADPCSSMVESHVGALALVIGSSVWITREQCWYLSKEDKVQLIPRQLTTLHSYTLIVIPGEQSVARLALVPFTPTTLLQKCSEVSISAVVNLLHYCSSIAIFVWSVY